MRLPGSIVCIAVSAWLAWSGAVHGQAVPGIPAAPAAVPGALAAPAAAGAPAVAGAPAMPTGPNLWTFFCPPPGCLDKCKEKICGSFVGQFMGAALAPVRMATGGMMKPCCPTANMANPADLAKSAESTAGAAARIKQDEAGAKARRADVRYLGTVDCHRFPEAEKALIKALRTDRNECVRWEAALALGNGCCCTRDTIEALTLTANGSDKDGNPAETSPRVKHAAAQALAHCQGRPVATQEPPERAVPLPEVKKLPEVSQNTAPVAPRVLPVTFASAPSASVKGSGDAPGEPTPNASSTAEPTDTVPTGQRGLFQIFMRRVSGPMREK